MDELAYWLLLLKAPFLGVHTFYKALQYFETPEAVFNTTPLIRKKSGIFKLVTLNWLNSATSNLVIKDLTWQRSANCHIITFTDTHYPYLLKQIADPPPLLYVCGNLNLLNTKQIAIVGSRNPSPSGRDNAKIFARELALSNITITSGMASGIDAAAHMATLEVNAQTIAVCATGLDIAYPQKHKNLAHEISNKGALVSEFPIGTKPLAKYFPRRNRIISGLSLAVLVVEATTKSGSLITARLAAEQGREVFAIPGSIHNVRAKGCHQLIKSGAMLSESSDDILSELSLENTHQNPHNTFKTNTKNVDKDDNILLKYLSDDPNTIDDLVFKSTLDVQVVNQELLMLELSGRIQNIPGVGFVLNR